LKQKGLKIQYCCFSQTNTPATQAFGQHESRPWQNNDKIGWKAPGAWPGCWFVRNNRNPEKTKYGHPPFRDAIIGGKTFDDFSRLLRNSCDKKQRNST